MIINVSKDGIYGILPYVDPEVLSKRPYMKVDIYRFSIIMSEVSTGRPPHYYVMLSIMKR